MKACDEGPELRWPGKGMPCIVNQRDPRVAVPILIFKDDDFDLLLAYDAWIDSLPDEERKRRGLT